MTNVWGRLHRRIAPPCQPQRSRLLWALSLMLPLLVILLWPGLWPWAVGLYLLGVLVGYTHPVCRATGHTHRA